MALSCSRRIFAHFAKLSWALTAFISFLSRNTSCRSRNWSCASLLELSGRRAENRHSYRAVSMFDLVSVEVLLTISLIVFAPTALIMKRRVCISSTAAKSETIMSAVSCYFGDRSILQVSLCVSVSTIRKVFWEN